MKRFARQLFSCVFMRSVPHTARCYAECRRVGHTQGCGGVLDGGVGAPPSVALMKGFLAVARPAGHSAAQNTQHVTRLCGTEDREENTTGFRDQPFLRAVCVNYKQGEQAQTARQLKTLFNKS